MNKQFSNSAVLLFLILKRVNLTSHHLLYIASNLESLDVYSSVNIAIASSVVSSLDSLVSIDPLSNSREKEKKKREFVKLYK